MKAIVIAALLALSFTTGFTCSKNQPETAPEATEMGTGETMPTETVPADGTVAPDATATPVETAPATETN